MNREGEAITTTVIITITDPIQEPEMSMEHAQIMVQEIRITTQVQTAM
jgi:hypothetical protein